MKKLILCLALMSLMVTPVHAQSSRGGGDTLEIPKGDGAFNDSVVEHIERTLNRIQTARGDFMQVGTTGGITRGKFYLSRPGKIKFEYLPPTPILLVSDGLFVAQIDTKLETSTHIPLKKTPLYLFLKDSVSLRRDAQILSVNRADDRVTMRVRERDSDNPHTLHLIFNVEPFYLLGWQIEMASGETSTLWLENPEYNIPLDSNLFRVPEKYR